MTQLLIMYRTHIITLGTTTIGLVALVLLAISRFDWNPSALLHVSHEFGETYKVPSGVVLYEDGGYDGMLYYQIARDIPELFFGEPTYDNAYRWQRILLPAVASVLSFGNDAILPWTILVINVASVLGSLLLFLKIAGKPSIHTLTIVGNPAALVGVLFSLTEPLALFFTTLFLFLWKKAGEHVKWGAALALALALLARETVAFLALPLLLLLIMRKQWRESFLLALVFVSLAAWISFLTIHFGALPLETGSGMFALPFSGILKLLQRLWMNPNSYVISSAAFLLLFFAPLSLRVIQEYRMHSGTATTLLAVTLGVFLLLDAHIWGVLTSVGRVLPALYPVYALWALEHDAPNTRMLSLLLIAVSTLAAIGVALSPHPFTIAS